MARPSLKDNVRKPDAEKAAQVAQKLAPVQADPQDGDGELFETVSYNLPVDLIDLVRDLAEARVVHARKEQRMAKRRGEKGPEARKSASAVVREALDAYRSHIEEELRRLNS